MEKYDDYYIVLGAIKKAKIDITKLYLLSCFEGSLDGTKTEIEKMEYCYDLWLNADVDLDLGRLADIVEINWNDIQNGNIKDTDIIEMCLNI